MTKLLTAAAAIAFLATAAQAQPNSLFGPMSRGEGLATPRPRSPSPPEENPAAKWTPGGSYRPSGSAPAQPPQTFRPPTPANPYGQPREPRSKPYGLPANPYDPSYNR